MSYAWKRAAKSMLVTSATTAFAFLATTLSRIVVIKALGLFAAIIIPVNYLLVIFIYPAYIIIHHKYITKLWLKCTKPCRRD